VQCSAVAVAGQDKRNNQQAWKRKNAWMTVGMREGGWRKRDKARQDRIQKTAGPCLVTEPGHTGSSSYSEKDAKSRKEQESIDVLATPIGNYNDGGD